MFGFDDVDLTCQAVNQDHEGEVKLYILQSLIGSSDSRLKISLCDAHKEDMQTDYIIEED